MKWTRATVEHWAALNQSGHTLSSIATTHHLSRQRVHQLFKLYNLPVTKHTHTKCTIPNCPRRHVARGYCDAHYQRWKAGDLRADAPVRIARLPKRPKQRPIAEMWPYLHAVTTPTDQLLADIASELPTNLPNDLRADAGQEAVLLALVEPTRPLRELVRQALTQVRNTFTTLHRVTFLEGIHDPLFYPDALLDIAL
jgi:hypothetical protein